MDELVRTTDPTVVPLIRALLSAEGIECVEFDVHMSVLEGSLGVLPRRVMVARSDAFRARAILRDNGLVPSGPATPG